MSKLQRIHDSTEKINRVVVSKNLRLENIHDLRVEVIKNPRLNDQSKRESTTYGSKLNGSKLIKIYDLRVKIERVEVYNNPQFKDRS